MTSKPRSIKELRAFANDKKRSYDNEIPNYDEGFPAFIDALNRVEALLRRRIPEITHKSFNTYGAGQEIAKALSKKLLEGLLGTQSEKRKRDIIKAGLVDCDKRGEEK